MKTKLLGMSSLVCLALAGGLVAGCSGKTGSATTGNGDETDGVVAAKSWLTLVGPIRRKLERSRARFSGSRDGTKMGRCPGQSPQTIGQPGFTQLEIGKGNDADARRTGRQICCHAIRHLVRKQTIRHRNCHGGTRGERPMESFGLLYQVTGFGKAPTNQGTTSTL
jgi:hypothetical protein